MPDDKITLVDQILFKMPKDRELQFPTMAVLQSYVNEYDLKMMANDVSQGKVAYQLRYDVEMDDYDWQFFQSIGLELKKAKTNIARPDAVMDFTEERINRYANLGKHVSQVCGLMCGVGCPPLPVIKKIAVEQGQPWLILDDVSLGYLDGIDHRLDIGLCVDGSYCGAIGWASWKTYYAASMGWPVIELLPVGRPRTWLSKWWNPWYRVIDPTAGDIPWQIKQAIASLPVLFVEGEVENVLF